MKTEANQEMMAPSAATVIGTPGSAIRPALRFAGYVLVLGVCFCKPLFELARYAVTTELFSHIPLIPLVSAYLIWQQRGELAGIPARPSRWAALPFLVGAMAIGIYWLLRQRGWRPVPEDSLCILMLSFYCLFFAGGLFFLGSRMVRALAFPAGFLIFIVPFPVFVVDALEVFFQRNSADATSALLALTGMPFVREGQVFQLPGISIRVAQECSGIRSSLVLFLTALLAGHLFLSTPWKKMLLAGFVVPLGILRNGFRIATIATLCVHVGPDMINSPIHRQGGPVFFVLSLAPFFLLLFYLRRAEPGLGVVRRKREAA